METERFQHAERQLAECMQRLNAVYTDYCEGEVSVQKPGIGDLFQGWFSSSRSGESSTRGTAFLDQVILAVEELERALSAHAQEQPDLCSRLAREAARAMLAPDSPALAGEAKWFVLAAEQYYEPLIPYLNPEALSELRARYLAQFPRRRMLPSQKKLLAQMERRLSGQA